MRGLTVVRAVAGVGIIAACSGPVGPEVVIQFVGNVEGLTSETRPATITAAAHANNDCAAGQVMDRASTQTRGDDSYSFGLTIPRQSTACVVVAIEAESETTAWGDTVTVTDVRPRQPVQEGDGTVTIPVATVRIVIRRPSP